MPDLPPLTWLQIIRGLPLRDCFRAALVSTAWRELALAVLLPELHVVLVSGVCARRQAGRLAGRQVHTLLATTRSRLGKQLRLHVSHYTHTQQAMPPPPVSAAGLQRTATA